MIQPTIFQTTLKSDKKENKENKYEYKIASEKKVTKIENGTM